MTKTIQTSLIAGLAAISVAPATAQTAVLTGNEDFSIHNVGESFFGGAFRRDAVNSRFQINGRNPASADRNLGLWAAFNVDLNGLFSGPVTGVESATIDLFQAQPFTGQDIDNIITGGTVNVYFTLDDSDVLNSANGFDWVDSDAEGLGDQFSDRVLVGSIDLVEGNFDASFDLDLSVVGADLLNQINSDGFVRFVFTTPDMDTATSFGVGAPSTSTVLGFDGPAPTITINAIPAPGSLALLGLAGFAARRRR